MSGAVLAAPVSAPEDLAPLAESLAERLAAVEVEVPGGALAPVVGPKGGPALLTPERLLQCLQTVSAAEAWPVAWLVVQRKELDFDLVMRVELDSEGAEVATPEFLFTVPRREWEIDDMPRVVRDATGRKPPRKGIGHVVLQSFSTRIETTYVYEPSGRQEGDGGLLALLPAGALIREATAVELDGGKRYTLALVLEGASFVPSACGECDSAPFGHADSGTITLVLTDAAEIVDRLDLTPHLRGTDGVPLLPRYPCDERHRGYGSVEALLASGDPVTLLKLADLDGDGRPLELELPAEQIDCDRWVALAIGLSPDGPSLQLAGEREISP